MFKVKGFHYELVAILGRFGKHIQTYPRIYVALAVYGNTPQFVQAYFYFVVFVK